MECLTEYPLLLGSIQKDPKTEKKHLVYLFGKYSIVNNLIVINSILKSLPSKHSKGLNLTYLPILTDSFRNAAH